MTLLPVLWFLLLFYYCHTEEINDQLSKRLKDWYVLKYSDLELEWSDVERKESQRHQSAAYTLDTYDHKVSIIHYIIYIISSIIFWYPGPYTVKVDIPKDWRKCVGYHNYTVQWKSYNSTMVDSIYWTVRHSYFDPVDVYLLYSHRFI